MEVKIPKEIRSHRESIFFGLSLRQFICSLGAVMVAVIVYLALTPVVGKETAGWVCILAAAPIAVAGFFRYNGMTFGEFVCAFVKSQILCARGRAAMYGVFRRGGSLCERESPLRDPKRTQGAVAP